MKINWLSAIYTGIAGTFLFDLVGAGIAGLDMNPWMPLITLASHFAYAIPLILLISVSISTEEKKPLRVLESQSV